MNRPLLCVPFLAWALAGCESKVSIDLAVADTDALEQVNLVIEGVDLLDEDSEVHSLSTSLDMPIDLRTVLDGQTVRLVDGAELDNGHYTGLRLRLADSGHSVVRADGTTVDLSVEASPPFADLDADLGEDENGEWIATLDLRFSLQAQDDGSYVLAQQLRAIDADASASVTGSLPASSVNAAACRQGRRAATGVAVYLYEGTVSEPSDYNTTRSGPIASAPVRASGSGYVYDLPYLVAGTYTVAWTCEADADDPAADDSLTFTVGSTFSLSAAESLEVDL